jgi:peptidylprolyl isomerase
VALFLVLVIEAIATELVDLAPGKVTQVPDDAIIHKSGLRTLVIEEGEGERKPGIRDRVTVHFSSWTQDGKLHDSSVSRNQPVTVLVSEVIPGWSEALQSMVGGEKQALWVPAALAYGERPGGGRPGGPMYFEIELLRILPGPELPILPKRQTSPPGGAQQGMHGLRWTTLKEGDGKIHNQPPVRVALHYDLWDTNAKLVDTTAVRGEPVTFDFKLLDSSWRSMVAGMVPGEKRRLWMGKAVPSPKAQPPLPGGPWIADLTLIETEAGSE